MQFGASEAHFPSALQAKAMSGTAGQSIPVHVGLQASPHSRPSHGSLPPQPGQPVAQWPPTHSDFGHEALPSGHNWHGAAMSGQSPSLIQAEPQLG
jgi:hypothetical protein